MKKGTLLLMLSFVLVVANVKADIILTDADEYLSVNAQITNLSDYPEVALVGYDSMLKFGKTYKDRIYNLGPMTFYIVEKKYLKKLDVNKNDWQKDKNAQKLNLYYDRKVVKSTEYESITVDYKLAKKGNMYYVYKSKETYKLRSLGAKQATADVVKVFKDNVVDVSLPINVYENIL